MSRAACQCHPAVGAAVAEHGLVAVLSLEPGLQHAVAELARLARVLAFAEGRGLDVVLVFAVLAVAFAYLARSFEVSSPTESAAAAAAIRCRTMARFSASLASRVAFIVDGQIAALDSPRNLTLEHGSSKGQTSRFVTFPAI